MSFSSFRIPSRIPCYIQLSYIFMLSLVVTVSKVFPFLKTLTSCEGYWSGFVECPCIGICLLFSWLDWGDGFWEQVHRDYLSSPHTQGMDCDITVGVDLDHLTEVVFVRFLPCTATLPIPDLSIRHSLEENQDVQSTLKGWGVM